MDNDCWLLSEDEENEMRDKSISEVRLIQKHDPTYMDLMGWLSTMQANMHAKRITANLPRIQLEIFG